MPEVTLNGESITIERFTLSKAMRVITLLQLIQKQMPELTKEWADFNRSYAEEYAVEVPRIYAVARLGLEISEAEWERVDHVYKMPATPSRAEIFFALAPMVYERAEQVTLRLLGLIALDNATVNRYVGSGDIWERVDEFVDNTIRPAPLDEIMELVITAAEVIDGQVLAKAKGLGDRAGNVARLFGMKTQKTETSSEQPEQPSSTTSAHSPSDTTGTQTTSEDSTGETSRTSAPLSSATA